MGSALLRVWREKIDRTWKLAFFSAFFCGLLTHLYKLTNYLPNSDAMFNLYSSQNMTASGRWFLSAACALSSWFDLPWLNGLLSLTYMGVTAAVITRVFQLKNPVLICLSGGLLVTFPAITGTIVYGFTADGYMLAMALAALSAALTTMEFVGRAHWKRWVLSGVCICLSCGIYQAYLSFAFLLAVCYFMTELLENRREKRVLFRWIGLQVLTYGCALAAYYGIWKLSLSVQGISATTYQGMNSLGAVNLPEAIVRIGRDWLLFFLEWNVFRNGITAYSFLNIVFLGLFLFGLIAAAWKQGCFCRAADTLLLLCCVVMLPVGAFVWHLTSAEVVYHGLMLQSLCVLYIFTAVLYERWLRPKLRALALAVLIAVMLNNAVAANVCYHQMNLSFLRTQATAVELSTRIHLLDDGEVRYVHFAGNLEAWNTEDVTNPAVLGRMGGWKLIQRMLYLPLFLHNYTDFSLSYYRSQGIEPPAVQGGDTLPTACEWQWRFPLLPEERWGELAGAVEAMPVWPARDSVQVIGDTVVVKLSAETGEGS